MSTTTDDPLALGDAFYVSQGRRNRRATNAAQRKWLQADASDIRGWFDANALDLVVPVLQAMEASAGAAQTYVGTQALAQGVGAPTAEIAPIAFTSDLSAATSMLYSASTLTATSAIAQGVGSQIALAIAARAVTRLVTTMVADAAREATQATMVSSRFSGYVRMLRLPSCKRCVVQAGKYFRWNTGFERHPKCDCVHIPAQEAHSDDLRVNPLAAIRSGKVTDLNRADTAAILDDGADISQVINAHRGLSTADVFGQRMQITNEGVTRRGIAYGAMGQAGYVARQGEMLAAGQRYATWRAPRLTPTEIYRMAENKSDALRLLKLYGYLLPD